MMRLALTLWLLGGIGFLALALRWVITQEPRAHRGWAYVVFLSFFCLCTWPWFVGKALVRTISAAA